MERWLARRLLGPAEMTKSKVMWVLAAIVVGLVLAALPLPTIVALAMFLLIFGKPWQRAYFVTVVGIFALVGLIGWTVMAVAS